METFRDRTCCACLSTDRKIIVLDDNLKKKYFMQLIWDITHCIGDVTVSLCWECDALLRRFRKFKNQAQKCFTTLQNCSGESLPHPETRPSLQIVEQFNIHLQPNNNDNNISQYQFHTEIEIIKTENKDILSDIIKEECNNDDNIEDVIENINYSDNYSDEDNTNLMELRNKKSNLNNFKKKRKKKETQRDTEDSEIQTEIIFYREKELTDQEIEEERRCLELREDYVNAVFKCEKCILSFPNADDLKDHISLQHELNSSLWKCEWCERTFASQVAYNYHYSKHARRYLCVVCGDQYPSKRGAVKHYEKTHMARPDLDYEDLQKRSTENDQILETNGDDCPKAADFPLFSCELCDKTFRWKTSLRKHIETHRIEAGQKRRPYCEPCSLSFTTTSNLQKHVKTSSKHQVQLKLRKLKDTSQLDNTDKQVNIDQIRSLVNSRRQLYACAQCDRKFQWRGNLLRHLHSHTAKANGELVCEPCNRTFSSIATYKQHMKISRKHVSEDEFKHVCSECGKRFANKTRLKDHVNWEHLKAFVHKCPICQKVFKSHTSLYLHKQVVHRKTNHEHLCDHCGKPFPNRTKLRSHIVALHTSEAPYACTTCNARFSWHSCLSRHVRRVHKGKLDKA